MDFQNLNETLVYLAGPIGAVAWFVYASALMRNLRDCGKLKTMQAWVYQLVVLAVSLSLPLIALAVVHLVPPETITMFQDVYAVVAAVSIAYLTQQGFYLVTKAPAARGSGGAGYIVEKVEPLPDISRILQDLDAGVTELPRAA